MSHNMTFRPQLQPLDTVAPQYLAAPAANAVAYTLCEKLEQHWQYNENKPQVYECIAAQEEEFECLWFIRTHPREAELLRRLCPTLHRKPPAAILSEIASLRRHPHFNAIRKTILARLQKTAVYQPPTPVSARTSHASSTSLTHRSTFSSKSTRSSGYSSNTDSYIYLDGIEGPDQHLSTPTSSTSNKGDNAVPGIPYTLTPTRRHRKAPKGYCYCCLQEECRGDRTFTNFGNLRNHMEDFHPQIFLQDHKQYLREDTRGADSAPVRSKAANKAARMLRSDPLSASYTDRHALSDSSQAGTESQTPSEDIGGCHHIIQAEYDIVPQAGYYGGTGISTIAPERIGMEASHPQLGPQGSSWLDIDEYMQEH